MEQTSDTELTATDAACCETCDGAAEPADASPTETVARHGRPETPDGYTFSPGETATGYDTDLADWFRAEAYDLDMPPAMAEALHDRFRERIAEMAAGYWTNTAQRQAEAEAALRADWGRGYEARLADAHDAVERFGGDVLRNVLNDSGIGDDPVVVRAFAEIGRALAAAADDDTGTGAPKSATAAQRKILQLRSDAKFMSAYGDRTHPTHDTAQTQMDELYALAYPSRTAGAREVPVIDEPRRGTLRASGLPTILGRKSLDGSFSQAQPSSSKEQSGAMKINCDMSGPGEDSRTTKRRP